VALPGFAANPYPFMRQAAMVALPSRLEGFGNVLVEAMHLGTPLIATDCPHGPGEILDHGRLGTLVGVGDVQAMAEAILATLAQPPDRQRLRAAATRYDMVTNARRYLEAMGLVQAQATETI
jgi:glycosyltransferase involved in cell wall biosynthesis